MDTSDQYFGCLCRTCMNKLIEASSIDGDSEPQQQWQSIFDMIEEEYGRLRIAELLSQAVPKLELQLSDELPKIICCKCLQQLLSVYRFQQMCLQSEQQMRQQVSKNKTDLSIPAATAAGDIRAHSFPLDNSSIQEPLLETTALVVKAEAAETSDVDHLLNIDQILEDCKDSQGNFSEFIKDAPVRDDGALSYSLASSQPGTIHQNLDHSSIQEPFLQTTDKIVTQVEAETSATDYLLSNDQLQEVSQGNFSEFVKNEPIEDDEPEMEYSDGDTIQSIISVKDEILAIESEEKIKETNRQNDHYVEDKPYKCPHCPIRFRARQTMYQHKAIHEGVKRDDCDICGKSIIKKNLKKHRRTHKDEMAHNCDFCERSFLQIHHLRLHMRQHNADPQDAVAKLQQVTKTGSQQPPKDDSQQQFGTKANENLPKNHITFDEDKLYECPHCPRRFNSKPNMYQHKAIHEEVKREDCDICGKSIKKSSLRSHKLIHSDVKAHKCEFCEKRFDHISVLRIHMRQHTGEKPYKCYYCESSFALPTHRRTHMRLHLGVNVYRCEFCPLAFRLAKELRVHLTTHKNEDSETRKRNMKALQEAEANLQLKLSNKKTRKTPKEKVQQKSCVNDPV